MITRQLGRVGPIVSALGVGFWAMGGGYGAASEDAARRVVDRAIELGATLFDTAPAYGTAESFLGRALGARRRRVFLVSKCGLAPDPLTGRLVLDGRPEAIRAHVEGSLGRLRSDALDLLLVHYPDPRVPFADTMGALDALRREGKARHLGVSNFSAAQLRASALHAPLVANQVGYHLYDRRWERDVFAAARELGIGIMAYSPLAHGLLAGRFAARPSFAPDDWRSRGDTLVSQRLLDPANLAHNVAVTARFAPVAARHGCSVAQLAIAWVLGHEAVATVITGSRRVAGLEENHGALKVRLSSEDRREMEQIARDVRGYEEALPVWPSGG